jgi:uncharacterized protein (TIGR03437 family)
MTCLGRILRDVEREDGMMRLVVLITAMEVLAGGLSAQITFSTSQITTGCNPVNVSSGDFNGDRKLDLAFACRAGASAALEVVLGNGDGTFQPPVGISGVAISRATGNRLVSADFNNDGKSDLAYISSDGNLNVLLSNGDGTFSANVITPSNPKLALGAAGDINADGVADLAFLSGANDSLVTYQFGKGDGTFGAPTVVAWPTFVTTGDQTPPNPIPLQVFIQDLNGDGKPDIGVSLQQTIAPDPALGTINVGILYALYQSGAGVGAPTLITPTNADTHTVAADFNGDGKIDYVFWGDINSDTLFSPFGGGNLTVDGPGAAADFSEDGQADLVYASSASNALAILSVKGGQFVPNGFTGLGSTAVDLLVGDFNGDGKPDIVTANGSNGTMAINTTKIPPSVSAAINAASFAGATLAPGMLASAFGQGFAQSISAATSIPLPPSLGGVSATVGGITAPLLFVSANQINFQVPWTVPAGAATLQITVGSTPVSPLNVTIGAAQPGIFSLQFGTGQAIAINVDGTLVAPVGSIAGLTTHPAKPGDTIIVYATGLGAVSPSIDTGAAAGSTLRTTVVSPTVLVGGVVGQVAFSGLSPQFVGVNQINVVIPSVPAGVVPLQLETNGTKTTDQVTVAIGN